MFNRFNRLALPEPCGVPIALSPGRAMFTKSLVTAVFAVLLVSGSAFAQSSQQQFSHLSPGDTEYFWQHGRDTPKQVDQIEASVIASWPYVALFIAGACIAEKVRE